MKSRLVNILRHPTCRGEVETKMEGELETRGEERGNTKEEFSCSLTPILGFMLGRRSTHEHTNTHTHIQKTHGGKAYIQNVPLQSLMHAGVETSFLLMLKKY